MSLPVVEVVRKPDNGTQTLGRLLFEGFSCDTLELPNKGNQNGISCIPAGSYTCIKRAPTAAIPYQHVLIQNVPGRSGICIHKVNYVRQLRGCIGVGDGLADIDKDGQLDIINSKKTFDKLMALLPGIFTLVIR